MSTISTGAGVLVLAASLAIPAPTASPGLLTAARSTKAPEAPVIVPVGLEAEHAVNPLGVDALAPRLSWRLHTSMPEVRSQKQTGYRIAVATDERFGDLTWDTGRVDSDESVNIRYAGREPLRAATRYYWKVKVWHRAGSAAERESAWSDVARWDMGLLADADWAGAQWIGLRSATPRPDVDYNGIRDRISSISGFSAPLLRRDFSLPNKPIRNATVFICGLGYSELYLNGRKVGDHVLDPGYTRYDATALYVPHDVTDLLLQEKGQAQTTNAVGVMLGRGFYGLTTPNEWDDHRASWHGEPKMRMRLRILFEDGEVQDVVSRGVARTNSFSGDPEIFKAAEGPIVFDSVRAGEIYDANRERPGWATAAYRNNRDYSRSHWRDAIQVVPVAGRLRSQMIQPIRVVRTIPPQEITVTRPAAETSVYDMGRQMAGWARVTVSGDRGDILELRYAQRLRGGRANLVELSAPPFRGSLGTGAYQTDFYVLKGGAEEIYEPRFSYKGFRYVEVVGKPTVRRLEGRLVHSDVEPAGTEPVGTFSSSDGLLNDFHAATRNSVLDNLHSVPTDCPQLEKNGWTAEDHLVGEMSSFIFDLVRLNEKRLSDLRDDQGSIRDEAARGQPAGRRNGKIRTIVPSNYGPSPEAEPGWEGSAVLLPWHSYLFSGDRDALADSYDSMTEYLRYLHSRSDGGLLLKGTLGDWASPAFVDRPPEKPHLMQSAYYFRLVDVYATISSILGASAGSGDSRRPEYLDNARTHRDLAEGDPATGVRRDGTDSIKKAFNARFFDAEKKIYTTHEPGVGYRQTSNVLALHFGLVPEAHEDAVFQNLVQDILVTRNGHLDVGIFGLRHLADVLIGHGRGDVAYLVFGQPDFPSPASILSEEGPTLKEFWAPSRARSLDHKMYGSVVDWMYRHVAGISYDASSPGFKRFIVQPVPGGDLTHAEGSYESPYGRIVSKWSVVDGGYRFDVIVPPNTAASVRIPKQLHRDVVIEEGGVEVWRDGTYRPGVAGIASSGGESAAYVSFGVESGHYSFRLKGVPPIATFNGTDSLTRGTWKTVYGNTGYQVRGLPPDRGVRLPSYVTVTATGGTDYTWKESTDDLAALQKPDGPERIAAHTYTTGRQIVEVDVIDRVETNVALYFLGRDGDGAFTVDVVDPGIGADSVVDHRTVSDARDGVFLRYKVKGRAQFRIVRGTGGRASFSGIFFDRAATFMGTDSITQDSWEGVYGTDGYEIRGPSGGESLIDRPAYVTELTVTDEPGDAPASSRPPRRIVSLNVNSKAAKEVALHLAGGTTALELEVIDPRLGDVVIDRRRVSRGANGIYLRYMVRGPVRFEFSNVSGPNRVLAGIFFGRPAVFAGLDSKTRDGWKAVYGTDGYDLGDLGRAGEASRLPADATVSYRGGLSDPERIIDVTVTGSEKNVAIYLLGREGKGLLTVTAEAPHPVSGATVVLDRQTVDDVGNGIYLVYKVFGHRRFRIRGSTSGPVTVRSALFFDRPVRFTGSDRETRGSWRKVYGTDGYEIREFAKEVGRKIPTYAEIDYVDGIDYTWPDGASTSDPRALQDPSNPAIRKAACRYAVESQTIRLNVAGGELKDFAIYFLDWDRMGRALVVELIDAETRNLIDERTLTDFREGVYLNYRVRGRLLFRLTKTRGDNAVFSGVFLGRTSTGRQKSGRR